MAKWEYELPTIAGFYWWHPNPDVAPMVVRFVIPPSTRRCYWFVYGGSTYTNNSQPIGRWSGPIADHPSLNDEWRHSTYQ